MTIVRWKIVNQLNCLHTYGHITKNKRIELGLNKSHHNDAFVIANGTSQQRATPFTVTQRRRNNRSLEKFYDAKYADARDGKTRAGKDLGSQKRTRSRENLPENLRIYRQLTLKKGRRAIRRQRYFFQPGDLVKLDDTILTVKGTMSNGKSVLLSNKKTKTPRGLELVTFGKGLAFEKQLSC